jgi:son of sevenless
MQKFGVSGNARKMTPNIPQNAPPSIIPKASNRKMKLLDIDPLEIARQLTLKESELFCKIRAMECLARAKEEQGDNDSIRLIISMSNKV